MYIPVSMNSIWFKDHVKENDGFLLSRQMSCVCLIVGTSIALNAPGLNAQDVNSFLVPLDVTLHEAVVENNHAEADSRARY